MRTDRWITAASALALMTFATVANAEDEEKKGGETSLPKAIKKTLKAKYPKAEIRGVAKEKNEEGETVYEVELTVMTKVDLILDEEGDIEETEKEIGVFELPKAVKAAAAKAFPKGKVIKAETLAEEDGVIKYEVVIAVKGKKPFEALMAANGKILKSGAKEAKGEEDEDDEEMEGKKEKHGEKAEKKEKHEDEEDEHEEKEAKSKKSKGGEKAEKKKEKDDDEDDDDDDDDEDEDD